MGFLADLLIRIGGDTSGLNTALDQAGKSVKRFGADMSQAGMALTASMTLPIVGIGAAALKAAGDMEQTKIAFTTLLKSADAASSHIEQLKGFALTTPFQFGDLAQASRLMQAYGFAAQDVVPKLRTIGNAVSALGGGREVLERVVRSMGEIGTRGKITGEQLRELSRAGIPALDAVAKKLGVTVAEAQKQVTAGAVDAKTATDGILEYMDRRFAGGMEAQSKTMLGSWSNIKDRLTFTMVDIGNALLPIARNIITDTLDPMLQNVAALAQGFASLPKPIQSAGLSLAGLAATLPVLILGVGTLIEKGLVIEQVFGALGALAMAPMLLGVAGGALGAAVAFTELGERTKDLHSLDGKIIEQLDKWIEKHKDLRNATGEDLAAMTRDAEKYRTTLAGMLDFGIIGMKEYAEKMKALKEAQTRIDLAPTVREMAAAGINLRIVADTAEEAFKTLGIASTAERQKNLREAEEAYAELRAKGTENGNVLRDAALKVKAAHEALYGVLEKTSEKYHLIGRQTIGLAILQAEIKQSAASLDHWIEQVAKAGGLTKYNEQVATRMVEAYKMLGDPPVIDGFGKMASGLENIAGAALLVDVSIQDVNRALDSFGLSSKKTDIELLSRNFDVLGQGMETGKVTVEQYTRAWIALVKAMDAAGIQIDPATKREVIKLEKQYGGQIGQTRKEVNAFQRELERTYHAISRGIASSIVNFKGWGETFKSIAKDTAQGILTIFIEGFFKRMAKELADLLANSKGVLGSIGKWLGGLAGGGSSAAGGAASAAGGAGSAAGGAGSAASGAASGVMGTIGAVSAAVGAVSSVVGNFQMAGMNKSLDVLVNHTLRMFNELAQFRQDAWSRHAQWFTRSGEIWQAVLDVKDAIGRGGTGTGGGKGGITFNNCSFTGSPNEIASAIFTQAQLAGAI